MGRSGRGRLLYLAGRPAVSSARVGAGFPTGSGSSAAVTTATAAATPSFVIISQLRSVRTNSRVSTGKRDTSAANRDLGRDRRAMPPRRRFVSTGEAAKELGVDIRSLQRWAQAGLIEPDYLTPGGHMRWDVERVRDELRAELRQRRYEP